jgi:C1A family cysteine protease
LLSLSEQQLVDCAFLGSYGNLGCNGGLMDSAFQYAIDHNVDLESTYSYTAKRGSCAASNKGPVQAHSFSDVTPNSPTELLKAVSIQPVSIAIEADQLAFQLYNGGVISANCGTNLDHGVLLTGYGTDPVLGPYWTVKNSWGTSWGENGFFRIARDMSVTGPGICGLQSEPSYPNI